jgi:tRNA (guanosine-2'-O-)-methyltransferase
MVRRSDRPPHRDALREALARIDPEAVVAALEELVTPERRARIASVLDRRLDSVTLLLDDPWDPHNGAAVLRSCEAHGVQRVHVLARKNPFSVSQAVAQGAERWVEVTSHDRLEPALAALAGRTLVGARPDGRLTPVDLGSLERPVIVLGNEHSGVSADLAAACHDFVRVPMRGFVESLNLSVTAAILLAAATTGRPGDLAPAEKRRLYARALVLSVPRARDVLAARGIDLGRG